MPGFIGGFFTAKNIYPWYETLNKPPFTPPNWVFSPVWTVLYLLMGVSLFLIIKTSEKSIHKTRGLVFFGVQLVLNACWSVVFFGFHSVVGGLAVIILLLLFIILSAFEFYKISKPAAYLLIPYLLWVGFALMLNFSIWIL